MTPLFTRDTDGPLIFRFTLWGADTLESPFELQARLDLGPVQFQLTLP